MVVSFLDGTVLGVIVLKGHQQEPELRCGGPLKKRDLHTLHHCWHFVIFYFSFCWFCSFFIGLQKTVRLLQAHAKGVKSKGPPPKEGDAT